MTCGKLHSLHQQGLLLAAEGIRMMEHTSPEPIMGSTAWLRRGLRRWLRDSPFPRSVQPCPCKVSSQQPSSHIRCSFLPSLPFPPRSHHLPLSPNPAVPSDQGVCLFTCLFQSTLSLLHISLRSPRLFYENLMMLWEF